jgi:hypothetical protein
MFREFHVSQQRTKVHCPLKFIHSIQEITNFVIDRDEMHRVRETLDLIQPGQPPL